MQDRFPDADIRNLAMDMEINQYIEEKWLPGCDGSRADFHKKWTPVAEEIAKRFEEGKLTQEEAKKELLKIPARGVLIKDYAELKLDPLAGTKYYYDKLLEGKDKKNKGGKPGKDGKDGKPGKSGTSGCKALDDMLDQMEAQKPTICDHKSWKEFEGLGEAEKRLMRTQTEFHLREVADQIQKSRGTIPGEMADILKMMDYKEPAKFDWKGYLRRFSGGSTKTYTKKLRRKFNKRYEGLPGLKIKTQRHVLVAVDTSGSVSKDELVEFFKEIYHISKSNTEVTVLQCDSAISNIAKYKKGCEEGIKIFGRGGTDFEPIIDYANLHTNKYTCLMVFTDGEAPAPEKCRLRTLWVHSSKSNINESLQGFKIKLDI